MGAEWRDVVGYDGLYKVSDDGRVMSHNLYRRWKEPHELPQYETNSGYYMVNLYRRGTSKHFLVHRLVAQAFLEKPDGCEYVNHKDENKKNNCVENLEWCTKSYNSVYYLNCDPARKIEYSKRLRDKETGELLSPYTKKGVPHRRKTG